MVRIERAEKSGLALEAQQIVLGKYEPNLAHLVLEWIKSVVGEDFDTDGSADNFVALFKDGTLLCRLANALEPGAVKKINTSTIAFKQMENISFFQNFAKKYMGSAELFQTVDLYEAQDPNAVLICLSALSRKSEKLFGKPGVGPKESSGEKREWTEEQLRAGQGVIGLQMGSNKGANASGINIGNSRHM